MGLVCSFNIPVLFIVSCSQVTNTPLLHILLASTLGLIPAQLINSHLGSTFRSMDELYTRHWDSYFIVSGQVLVLFCLLAYIAQLARHELSKKPVTNSMPDFRSKPSSEPDKDVLTKAVACKNGVIDVSPQPADGSSNPQVCSLLLASVE